MFLFLPSCGGKKQNLADAVSEGDSLPDMHTTGVTTLISDSGLIRYKIVTEEWLIYSKRNPPFWAFEKRPSTWKSLTQLFHIDASIKAEYSYITKPRNYGNCVEMYIYKASAETNSIPSSCTGIRARKKSIPTASSG